jgi:AraC-like DNA-binding protein
MSHSSFFKHFRAVATLSPRQFQKQLRSIEARQLMLAEGAHHRRAINPKRGIVTTKSEKLGQRSPLFPGGNGTGGPISSSASS